MLITIANTYLVYIFVLELITPVFNSTALESLHTNDNTPSMPLSNAHLEGFFI